MDYAQWARMAPDYDVIGAFNRQRTAEENSVLARLRQTAMQREMDAEDAALEEERAAYGAASTGGLDQLRQLGTKTAYGLATSIEDRQAKQAELQRRAQIDAAENARAEEEARRKRYEYHVGGLSRFKTVGDIKQHLADGVVGGMYSMDDATSLIREAPKTDADIPAWLQSMQLSTMTPERQLEHGRKVTDSQARADAAAARADQAEQRARLAERRVLTAEKLAQFRMGGGRPARSSGGGGGGGLRGVEATTGEGGMAPQGIPGMRPPAGQRFRPDGSLEPIPGGSAEVSKPVPQKVVEEIRGARSLSDNMKRLSESFKKDYGSLGVMGFGADLERSVAEKVGFKKDAVQWWKEYDSLVNLIERNALFGATLTSGEKAAWQAATIGPGTHPDIVANNLAIRAKIANDVRERIVKDYSAAGYGTERMEKIGASSQKLTEAEQKELDALRKRFGKTP